MKRHTARITSLWVAGVDARPQVEGCSPAAPDEPLASEDTEAPQARRLSAQGDDVRLDQGQPKAGRLVKGC